MLAEGAQIEKIINSSYLHLKHYGEYHESKSASFWADTMRRTKAVAREHLKDIIQRQEELETQRLNALFKGNCTIEDLINSGFSQENAQKFVKAFDLGKNGTTIQERVRGLNQFLQIQLNPENYTNSISVGDAALKVINEAFSNQNISSFDGKKLSLRELELFISSLNAVARVIDTESRKKEYQGLMGDSLQAAVRKLNGATKTYIDLYRSKAEKTKKARQKLEGVFTDMENFFSTTGIKNWNRTAVKDPNFNDIKAVIERSVQGYLNYSGGEAYEKYAIKEIENTVTQIFKNTVEDSFHSRKFLKGTKQDTLGKFEKADVSLTVTFSTQELTKEYFRISFSVKKKESGGGIEVHNGGSLFAYSDRFAIMGADAGADFSFLKDGNFQYVYVNENMQKSDSMIEAVEDMLRGAGFLFLGEEIGKQRGADFLFIQGKVYAFSTILNKILENENAIQVRVDIAKNKQPITDKAKLVETYESPNRLYYSDEFIKKSQDIGKQVIYGTTFKINLLKSSYNF